jgi:hypothetical protein
VTITNREVFANDPTIGDIPNLGVAKVRNPEDASDWATLEWELRSFVCEGEYERGLDRILSQFLAHLSQNEQPAVWVSGFYGSGKSHLMRVLEYLWRDISISGTSARDLVDLPAEIKRHLTELSTAAKREGGLWSAAGTLGAGAAGSVRLAFLGIVFESAGLPHQYAPARLAMFLREHDMFDGVKSAVEAAGKEFEHELRNLYVSPVLAEALISSGAKFGTTPAEVSAALRSQYPTVTDIGNDEMLDTFEDVLRLQTTTEGKLPLTLVVLDEMQQYINEDNAKAEHVQHIVEGCSSRFDSRVLVVATGQADLTANAALQKLIDRFSVNVALSDTDVETVVRKVVLRKAAAAQPQVLEALDKSSGEINRHLAGTRIGPKGEDKQVMVADYPLLPTRRRFWERALRAIDKAGKSGVLRTQLKIVHEAARSVADQPLGFVVGGDFMFRSESASMLQSGVLLKEIDELIRGLQDGTTDGELKSRVCALVFLISQLPHDGVGDTGVRATADMIADLMVEDLAKDGALLRREVPRVLEELVQDGKVMKLGEEFRLQTEEGAEWTKEFNRRRTSIRDDATRMSSLRKEQLYSAVEAQLAGIKLVQGSSITSRKIQLFWDDDEPADDGPSIPVWIRDEWNVTESRVKESAAKVGTDSPIVFVLLPKVDADAIRDALAEHAAAQETVTLRPEPQTEEGRQAKQAMQSRVLEGVRRLTQLFDEVVANARVWQGGGNELTITSLRASVQSAAEKALSRKFHKFNVGDHADWGKVVSKVREGAPDALSMVGWTGEVNKNPVCKEVLDRVSGGGTTGSEIHKQLTDAPYGWPADAVNGALLVLLASRAIRAQRDHAPVTGPKELPPTQIGKTTFYKEVDPLTMTERLKLRGLLEESKVPYVSGNEEAAVGAFLEHLVGLASSAGGPSPLPAPPDITHLADLRAAVGNEQARGVVGAEVQLRADLAAWSAATGRKAKRLEKWNELEHLLGHAASVPLHEVRTERTAIFDNRLLLADPDPVEPLIDDVCKTLRRAFVEGHAKLRAAYASQLDEITRSDGWSQLTPEQQQQVLKDAGLTMPDEPDVGTNDGLRHALSELPLVSLDERVHVLPARGSAARAAIAKILEPEPTVVEVKLPSETLRTEPDVSRYLESLRTTLMGHIAAGETVITS